MDNPEQICSKCKKETELIHENGLCPDCEIERREQALKEYLEEHPFIMTLGQSTSQPGYLAWECHIIPEVCPYCKEVIKKEKVRGKPYYLHFCHDCKIYFGHEKKAKGR